ncbi:MAG: class I SAM-dependent methyltransferase [Gammaproteobacteria bacterium]|nr:class I SAM-dependent methyltransferase [Gammaproteobacteria bacterium]
MALSYQDIEKLLGFEKPLPVTKDWSAAPDFLKIISDYCLDNRPLNIVECSSGTSSLVLSKCCQLNQCGHVYSLENGEEYVHKTRQQLKDFSLTGHCDVIHAPLKSVVVHAEKYQWYDLKNFPDVEIDLLVIDGPPGFIQKFSRYPALSLLNNNLAKHCAIFLDDAARDDELALVRRWLKECPEFASEYIENERGCAILSRHPER